MIVDKQEHVYEDWRAKHRRIIAGLITDELIEEHRAKPLGQHSETLERVLQFFRRQPQGGKLLGVVIEPWAVYRIGVLSGVRGVPAQILPEPTFKTQEDLLHGIFLRRVQELQEAVK